MLPRVRGRLVFEDRHTYHGSLETEEDHEGLQAPVSSCAKNQGVDCFRNVMAHAQKSISSFGEKDESI